MIEAFNLNMIWAAVAAALVVLAVGPFLIPELHKLKFGQSIREEGPKVIKQNQEHQLWAVL